MNSDWERCSGWLQAALDKAGGTHSLEDVRKLVERKKAQFWPGERSALVTEVLTYPQTKRVRIWLAGGDMAEITSLLGFGEKWARSIGADALELVGRKGWGRVLDGFDEQAVYLVRELR